MHRHCLWWVLVVLTVSCKDNIKHTSSDNKDSEYPTHKTDQNRHLHSKTEHVDPKLKDDHTGYPSPYDDSYGSVNSHSTNNVYSSYRGKHYAFSYPYHSDSNTYDYTSDYHYNPYVNGDRFPNSYLEYQVDHLEKMLYKLRQRNHFGDPFDGLVFVDKNEILAFRAMAGIGQTVFERYIDTGNNDDESALTLAALPCGCRTPYGPCDRHFRSRILDAWPTEFFKKVRVTLYKDGKQVAFIDFDPANSTFLDFFRQERVKDSSYVHLTTADVNRFSIEGIGMSSRITRRFLIYNTTMGCPTRRSILFVSDIEEDLCHDAMGRDIPIIFYSKTNTTGIVNNRDEVDFADVLAVTVIIKDHRPEHRKCFP